MKIRIRPAQMLSGLFRRFAPSAVVCLLLTAYGITSYQSFFSEYSQGGSVLCALTLSLLFATATSCLCERYGWKKFIAWPAAAVGAGGGFLLGRLIDETITPPFIPSDAAGYIFIGLSLCSLMLCLHSVSRGKQPAVRLAQVCGWFFLALGVSFVCFIALEFCVSALFSLIFQNAHSDIQSTFSVSIAYICFLLLAPWLFLGGLPDEDTPSDKRRGFRRFTGTVLLPLYLLLVGILLLYVLKIAVTWAMPVGVMNSYSIAALTLFLFFRLTLTGEENKISALFLRWGGWLLLPIIAVQGIGVWMRVSAYGLTEMRVLGLIWTALCVAAVITSLFRKNVFWFFPVAAALSLIIFCTPLSARNAAILNQENRLSAALTRSGMLNEDGAITANPDAPDAEKEIIYSAVDYLMNASSRSGSIGRLYRQAEEATGVPVTFLSDERLALMFGFERPDEEDWYYHNYRFVGSASQWKLDVRGYAHAELITAEQWGDSLYFKPDKDYDPSVECRGTTDLTALTASLEPYRSGGGPVTIDTPVTFRIGGEEIDLAPLMSGAVFSEDGASLTEDTLILASGQELRFIEISVSDYASETARDSLSFTAWLMMPEAH